MTPLRRILPALAIGVAAYLIAIWNVDLARSSESWLALYFHLAVVVSAVVVLRQTIRHWPSH